MTIKEALNTKALKLHERPLFKTRVTLGLSLKDDISQLVESLDKYKTQWRIKSHGRNFVIVRTPLL